MNNRSQLYKPYKIWNIGVLVLALLLIFNTNLFSQSKEGNNWFFGHHAGLKFNADGTTSPVSGGATIINNNLEGTATISDTAGNLLFYTDGQSVWNKNHALMANGLKGHFSSTQSGVIVPHPTNPDTFYIFTVDAANNNLNNGLQYSIVDMNLNSGLGGVPTATKNIRLTPINIGIAEKITAVRHCNNVDIWVICHGFKRFTSDTCGNQFYAFLLTPNGVVTTPVISTVGSVHQGGDRVGSSGSIGLYGNSRGYLKASPDGKRIALAIAYDGCTNPPASSAYFCTTTTGAFEVFDFDYTTGLISNPIKFTGSFKGAYGVEFSPNGDRLYGSTWNSYTNGSGQYISYNRIYQWNLTAGSSNDIKNSIKTIANESSNTYGNFGALQLASNGQIYAVRYGKYYLSSIKYPNKIGTSCGYTQNSASLVYGYGGYGLPTFVQTYFDPNLGFDFYNMFEGMTTVFKIEDSLRIDSVHWLFNDTNSSSPATSTAFSPTFKFSGIGTYNVQLIVWKCNIVDTIEHLLTIHPRPDAAFTINDTAQCRKDNVFKFTNTSTIESGSIVYNKWFFGDGDTSNLVSPTHIYNREGVFTVKLITTSDKDGIDSITHVVKVISSPNAIVEIFDTIQCLENNLFYIDNGSYIDNTSSLSFYWDFDNGDTSTIKYIPPVTFANFDTFNIKLVVVSDSGCTDTAIKSAYVRPMPTASFSVNDTGQCLRGNVFNFTDLSAIAYDNLNYLYDFDDGGTSNFQHPNYNYNSSGTYTIKQLVISEFGCRDSSYKTIEVFPMPSTNFSINDSMQCLRYNLFGFVDLSTISSGSLNYYWDFGDLSITNTKNPDHIYSSYDTFIVTHITTSDKNCFDTLTKYVYVHPMPMADFTIDDSAQCLTGNIFNLTNISTILWGSLTYTWYLGDGNSSTNQNLSYTYSADDTFDILLIAKSTMDCYDSTSKVSIVFPMPSIDYSINDTAQCLEGNSFEFTNNSSITKGSIDSFFWSFGNGDSSILQSTNYSYNTHDTFTTSLLIKSDQNCSAFLEKDIVVYPMPLDIDEQATSESIDKGLVVYYPFNGNANDFSGNGLNATVSGAIQTTGILGNAYYFDGSNDYIEKTYDVKLEPGTQSWTVSAWFKVPTGALSSTVKLVDWYRCGVTPCGGSDNARFSLEMSTSGKVKYKIRDNNSAVATGAESNQAYNDDKWHFVTGIYDPLKDSIFIYIDNCMESKVYASLGSVDAGSNSVPLEIGRHYVTGWGSPSEYFKGTIDEVRIYNRALNTEEVETLYKLGKPVSVELENNFTCKSDSVIIKVVSPQKSVRYQLVNATSSNSIGIPQRSSCADTLFFSTGAVLDTAFFKIMATDVETSCSKFLDTIITIYNYAQPQVDFSVNNNSQCFEGNNFLFANISSISTGALTYLWDFDDLNSSTSQNPSHSYAYFDSFDVKLIATSEHKCMDSLSSLVYVRPMPDADFTINDSSQCFYNNEFYFYDNTTLDYGTYNVYWDFGNGNSTTLNNPTQSYLLADTFTVKLVINSNYNCSDSISKLAFVRPMPIASYDVNDSDQCLTGNQFDFTNTGYISSGTYTSFWNFDDGAKAGTTDASHVFSNFDSFHVKLVISSEYGCKDSVEQNMIVYPMPVSGFDINDSQQCFTQQQFNFSNFTSIPYGSTGSLWSFGDGTNSIIENPTHLYNNFDTFEVKLISTSNYGCQDSIEKTVYVFQSSSALFSIDDTAQCLNENSFLFKNTKSRTKLWEFGDGDTSSFDWPTHIYNTHDTFTVTFISRNDYECFDTLSKVVIVHPSPLADFNISDSQQCFVNNSFEFLSTSTVASPNTLTYTWEFGDNQQSTSSSPTISYTNDDTFVVKLVAISNLGCEDSISKNVYVFPNPVAEFSINDSQQCFNGNSFEFLNQTTINTGVSTYLWTFGDNQQSTTNNPTVSYSWDDTFTVKLVANSDLGCSDSMEHITYVFPSPIPDFDIDDSVQCYNGHHFNFTNFSTINTGSQTYLWDFGDGNSSTVFNPSKTYSYEDTFLIKLVNTSDLGCKDSISKNVYVFPNPVAEFSINDSQQCFNGNSFEFLNQTTIKTGVSTYLWDFGDNNQQSTTNNPTISYSWDDTFAVKLVANSDLGCSDSMEHITYVFPSPIPNFDINDTIQCFNSHQFYFTNFSTINTGSQTYFWDFGDGNSSTVFSPSKTFSYEDTFLIKLVNTSDLGCKDSISKNIYIFPNPVAEFSINDSQQCFNGNSFEFLNQTTINTGVSTYFWDFGDNNQQSTTNNPTISYSWDDTFAVKLVANSDLGCKDSVNHTSYVFPSPVASFQIDDSSQCLYNNDFVFLNTSTINTGTFNNTWDFGDGAFSSNYSPNHSYNIDDTFQVSLLTISGLGCRDSIEHTTYTHPMPFASFSISDSQQCLSGNLFSFTDLSQINSGTIDYTWKFGFNNDSSNSQNPVYSYANHDTFTVSLYTTSALGCKDSLKKKAYVFPMPEAGFSINDTVQCYRDHHYVFNNSTTIPSGTLSYNWSFGDAQYSSNQNPDHFYATWDTFTVDLMATSGLGCQDSQSYNVRVVPMPIAEFSIDNPSQCLLGNNFNFTNNSTVPYFTNHYEWYFGDGDTSSSENTSHFYAFFDTITVRLIAISEEGCRDTIEKDLYVHPMPNTDFAINDSMQCLEGNLFEYYNTTYINSGTLDYYWDLGQNQTSIAFDPSITYLQDDTLQIKLLAVSEQDCKDSIIKTVYIHPMPTAKYALYDTSQCFEKNAFGFTNQSSIKWGNIDYCWNFGDGDTSILINPIHSYAYPDTFVITLIAKSEMGCMDTVSGLAYIHVHPEPEANFIINDSAQCLFANNYIFTDKTTISSGFVTYNWEFGDGDTSTLQNTNHKYNEHDTLLAKLLVISDWGCKDSILKPVIIFPMPKADFVIDDSSQCLTGNQFEFTQSSNIPWGNLTHKWDFDDGSQDSGEIASHSFVNHDTFNIQVISTSEMNCSDTFTKNVYVHPMPLANFGIDNPEQCVRGNVFSFTDSSNIYSGTWTNQWEFGDGQTSTNYDPTHSYTYFDTFIVKLLVSSDQGCEDSISKQTVTHAMPSSAFSINDSQQCLNENLFDFTNNSTIPYGYSTYEWVFGDGDSSFSTNTQHHYNQDDTVWVNLIATSDLGCKDSIQKHVYIFPSPEASFDIDTNRQCFDGNVFNFTNTTKINSGSLTYFWDFGDNQQSTLVDPQHTYNSENTFLISIIATSGLGCKDTNYRSAQVLPSPNAIFSINQTTQCLLENEFVFTNNSNISNGYVNYYWDFEDGAFETDSNTSHSFNTYDTFSVKLIATSGKNCKDSISKDVVVHPMPVADFSIDDSSQCLVGNDFSFNNLSVIPYGNLTYNWKMGDGATSNQMNPTHSYATYNTYTVNLITVSQNLCRDTIEKQLIVHPMPVAGFDINEASQCLRGNKFQLTNKSTVPIGNLIYKWSFGNNDSSFMKDPIYIYPDFGDYDIELLAVSDFNCLDSITKTAFVRPMPKADFTVNDSTQCLTGNDFQFTNKSNVDYGSLSYLWDFGDGDNSTIEDPQHQYGTDNTFLVMLISTSDTYNCPDTIVKTMTVHPMPEVDFTHYTPCLLDSIRFTDLSIVNAPDKVIQWDWNFGDGFTSSIKNPLHIFTNAGTFSVKLTATTDKGCSGSKTKDLLFYDQAAAPVLDRATVKDEQILVEWIPATQGRPMEYYLERSSNGVSFNQIGTFYNPDVSYIDKNVDVAASSYIYKIRVKDSCNFISPYSNIGKTILLKVDENQEYPQPYWTKYLDWTPGVDYYNLSVYNQRMQKDEVISTFLNYDTFYLDDRTNINQADYCYTVTAYRNDNQFSKSNVVCAATPFNIQIPTAFTPNDDGLNDSLEIKGTHILSFEMKIYNRWGELMFETDNILERWDGKFKGELCPMGVYYVYIDARGTVFQKERYKGSVTLIR